MEYTAITNKRKLTVLLIVLLVFFIIIPIFLNIFIVYKHTLNVIKKEKLKSMEQLIIKTFESLQLTIDDIENSVAEFANSMGLRKSLQEYYKLKPKYQHSIDMFIERKLNEILDNNPYISRIICITENGRIYTNGISRLDISNFKSSQVYSEINLNIDDILWGYDFTGEKLNSNLQNIFYVVHKIKDIDNELVLGYLIAYIDLDKFKNKYRNIKIAESGEVYIINSDLKPIISKSNYEIPKENLKNIKTTETLIMNTIKIKNEDFVISLMPIKEFRGYLVGIVPLEELYYSTKKALRRNNIFLSVIGIVVSVWILIVIYIISKLVSEKEMTKYRLYLTEEMNEKLRMYKHDFTNHLQIIQGLLELKKPDRAYKYLNNVAKEGKLIKQNYTIGIPELEAAIFTTISKAREYNIDVKVESEELPEELPVNLYDLIKILVNLIKNAVYALKNSQGNYKELVIRISSELDELVFEVSNNTPIIPVEIRDKIFEKGFSSDNKEEKGLGLYIVKQLVKKNSGRIELKVDEKGNHFFVYFPMLTKS
ncbi:Spo0B domain-containing protein [Caloranaerobacter ferrireducens]|uniref:Spo0B domain-containing protein n=1 Tax=Caloranaerobacter ferrireducens TaxID=1323370 RepID=UPI00084D7AC7|nr:Spo0B domain-containing protein [Caloranaerobacter ferrireducens]